MSPYKDTVRYREWLHRLQIISPERAAQIDQISDGVYRLAGGKYLDIQFRPVQHQRSFTRVNTSHSNLDDVIPKGDITDANTDVWCNNVLFEKNTTWSCFFKRYVVFTSVAELTDREWEKLRSLSPIIQDADLIKE